ncbi:cob(I)yrinic acid a,c-diamide adenosyltransferase [Halanaerobaculum tunisiense]
MSIYTGNGDKGNTDLFSGERVKKYDTQVEAYGVIDEANSWLGLARAKSNDEQVCEIICKIQQKLFVVGAELASRKTSPGNKITAEDVSYLEEKIDLFNQEISLGNNFSISGSSETGSILDIVRTVIRRAERRIIEVSEEDYKLNDCLLQYINRLSDLLFMLGKVEDNNQIQKIKEEIIMKIDLNDAERMIEAAKKEAENIEVPMVISVVDNAGNLKALERMDNALQVSIGLARQKAYTAVVMRNTSEEVGKLAQPGNELYGIEVSVDDLVTFGGGIPLYDGDEVIGAVGVSGGAVEEDIQVAEAGVNALGTLHT